MISQEQIDEFFSMTPMAVVGVSRNVKKFGYVIYAALKEKNISVVPVNPNTDTIGSDVCYRNIAALPDSVRAAVVITSKKETLQTVQALIDKGIKQIWIQHMSDTPESIELCKKNYVNLIYGKCMLMFLQPVKGIHKFHRSILKLFGKLPK
jgi:predicted CoA-binding protein